MVLRERGDNITRMLNSKMRKNSCSMTSMILFVYINRREMSACSGKKSSEECLYFENRREMRGVEGKRREGGEMFRETLLFEVEGEGSAYGEFVKGEFERGEESAFEGEEFEEREDGVACFESGLDYLLPPVLYFPESFEVGGVDDSVYEMVEFDVSGFWLCEWTVEDEKKE